jgi:hypothetical protein
VIRPELPRSTGNRAHPPLCDAPVSSVMRGNPARSA